MFGSRSRYSTANIRQARSTRLAFETGPKPIRFGERDTEVEQPFDVPLIDLNTGEVLDRALVGTVDLLERDAAGGLVVVDLKTSARKYTDLQVEASLQLSVYSYATRMNGPADEQDLRLRFDVLTKTKQPELIQPPGRAPHDPEQRAVQERGRREHRCEDGELALTDVGEDLGERLVRLDHAHHATTTSDHDGNVYLHDPREAVAFVDVLPLGAARLDVDGDAPGQRAPQVQVVGKSAVRADVARRTTARPCRHRRS